MLGIGLAPAGGRYGRMAGMTIRGESPISSMMREIEKLEEYERIEREAQAVKLYLAALLPQPSRFWKARRWLRYLPLRIWHRISDPFIHRAEWLAFRKKEAR